MNRELIRPQILSMIDSVGRWGPATQNPTLAREMSSSMKPRATSGAG